ncbi:MAG: amidase family protein, partial [Pseudomonadota bacterium]
MRASLSVIEAGGRVGAAAETSFGPPEGAGALSFGTAIASAPASLGAPLPLAGKTIALKDNVCLAGVPMMNGASTLKGYTPDLDATIVTRILEA